MEFDEFNDLVSIGVCVIMEGEDVLGISGVGVFLLLGGSTGKVIGDIMGPGAGGEGPGLGDKEPGAGEGPECAGDGPDWAQSGEAVAGEFSLKGEAGKGTVASILLRYCWCLLESYPKHS